MECSSVGAGAVSSNGEKRKSEEAVREVTPEGFSLCVCVCACVCVCVCLRGDASYHRSSRGSPGEVSRGCEVGASHPVLSIVAFSSALTKDYLKRRDASQPGRRGEGRGRKGRGGGRRVGGGMESGCLDS